LLEGAARVAIYGAAALLVLAPWGLQSADMLGSLRALAFGFNVGGVTVSLGGAFAAVALFALGVAATRALQRWLDATYLPQTRLDVGLRNTIRTSVGYVGALIALTLGLGRLGLSLDRLALVAGALSLGVGFGLQTIVANVVSGLILLLERAIRVGDWIVVGTDEGFVRRINVRATEIETFDRATVIVPNSNLVAGTVRNWVRTDRVGRVLIPTMATFESGPEPLREVLIAAARAHPLVLKIPSPLVLFTGFADWGLKLDLICFVDDVETAARVKSDLLFDIHARMVEKGLHWPHPAPAWATVVPPAAIAPPTAVRG
ncbi:MAG: mechanosensitive ion channel, partial [Hyphomicrobiales bacterium]|nr:mechanosensitive ion channel [Hyphomicrobiales bacterium]